MEACLIFDKVKALRAGVYGAPPLFVEKDPTTGCEQTKRLYGHATGREEWSLALRDFAVKALGRKVTSVDKSVFFRTEGDISYNSGKCSRGKFVGSNEKEFWKLTKIPDQVEGEMRLALRRRMAAKSEIRLPRPNFPEISPAAGCPGKFPGGLDSASNFPGNYPGNFPWNFPGSRLRHPSSSEIHRGIFRDAGFRGEFPGNLGSQPWHFQGNFLASQPSARAIFPGWGFPWGFPESTGGFPGKFPGFRGFPGNGFRIQKSWRLGGG